MKNRIVQSKIRESEANLSVLSFLLKKFSYHNSEEWEKIISRGLIRINGKTATTEDILCSGDILSYDTSSFKEPAVSVDFTVVFENENYLIVNKPGNLPVHPAGPFFKNTLWWLLKKKYDSIHIITRLDRETSGLMLVAKNSLTAANFAKLNFTGKLRKQYITVVFGNFPEGLFLADGKLFNKDDSIIRKKKFFEGKLLPVKNENLEEIFNKKLNPSSSLTLFSKRNSLSQKFSVIDAELISGRTHQIRAVLSSLGYPIVGDKIYGVDENLYIKFIKGFLEECDLKKLGAKRQLLHCKSLSFQINDEIFSFQSECPDDFIEFYNSCS
ncbi:MAG TPA: RluA family pseudouridine synthase [Victivallales bacterium]|nr:RluA family pseudouridine synthase [Victivallales bacterium]HRR28667.1 RluA family pseudouridine synthase [Victivallales bacterium]HRU00874.1 RluA family pseudouridine synthase [Victivallales bacterium]